MRDLDGPEKKKNLYNIIVSSELGLDIMKIEWHFDTEEEWDPYTLLGDIKIIDDCKNTINDQCTILDSWFRSLHEGLLALSNGQSKDIDLIDEPDLLSFQDTSNGKFICYRNQHIQVIDVAKAIGVLRNVLIDFLEALLQYPEPRDDSVIKEVQELIKSC